VTPRPHEGTLGWRSARRHCLAGGYGQRVGPSPGADPFLGTAADVTDEFVLEKCDYFTKVQLWPLRMEVNPRLWLENFEAHERRHARYLLNAFLYLSGSVVEQIVVDCFEALSRDVVLPHTGSPNGRARWASFVEELRVVVIRGEEPRPTDSGHLFSRIVRDRLDVPEARILDVPEALAALDAGLDAPIVFVDDFVGSGDQFCETWSQPWNINGEDLTFEDVCSGKHGPFVYTPVLATSVGVTTIRNDCPQVVVEPGHELPSRYSVFHPDSLVWPDELRATATDFIREASVRAGIPDTDGGEDDWRGYHKLGLTVAFSHGVPDATIPLFWWESETWNPLKKRHREL
jgi:hypothetical protein